MGRNVPICGENIFLKGVLDIFTIVYHTFMFGKKFIPKIVSIFGKKILLNVVLDIVTIVYPTLLFGKKFIPTFVPIFGKKFLLKALLHIVTIKYPTFLFGKTFILKIVPICWENILLKGVLDIFYHGISYFYVWEEIYSETLTKYLGRKFFFNLYATLLPLCVLRLYLGRKLF